MRTVKQLLVTLLLLSLPLFAQANLPQAVPVTQQSLTPSSNIPVLVTASGDLQAAITASKPGDKIVVDPLYTGSITAWPCGTPDQYITLTTASALIPDEYTRISPAFAGVASKPGRPLYTQPSGGAQRLMPQLVVTKAITGGCFFRVIGFEITRKTGTGTIYAFIDGLGTGAIFDRVWIHGTETDESVRGIDLSNSTNVAIINSYFSDFHCRAPGTCSDAQAITGGNDKVQSGKYLVKNNYLESSGENFLLGGGSALFTPVDISIISNDFFKPLTWNPLDPSYNGGTAGSDGVKHPWLVKNLFELKNAERVEIKGNRMRYTWGGFSQVGAGVLFTAKNQGGANGTNICPACKVVDVTFRYNWVSNVGQALQIACVQSGNGGWPAACNGYDVYDNIFDELQYPTCYQCNSFANEIASGVSTNGVYLYNVNVHNNNFVLSSTGYLKYGTPGVAASAANAILELAAVPVGSPNMNTGIHWDNNIFDPGNNGIYSTGGGVNNCFSSGTSIAPLIAKCWPNGSMTGNQIVTTVPLAKTRLPWPIGNDGNPNAGANVSLINEALAGRR